MVLEFPDADGVATLDAFEKGLHKIHSHSARMTWAGRVGIKWRGGKTEVCSAQLKEAHEWLAMYGLVALAAAGEIAMVEEMLSHPSFNVRVRSLWAIGKADNRRLVELLATPLPVQLKAIAVRFVTEGLTDSGCELIANSVWGGAVSALRAVAVCHNRDLAVKWVEVLVRKTRDKSAVNSVLRHIVSWCPDAVVPILDTTMAPVVRRLCVLYPDKARELLRTSTDEPLLDMLADKHPWNGKTQVLRIMLDRWEEGVFSRPCVIRYIKRCADSDLALVLRAVEVVGLGGDATALIMLLASKHRGVGADKVWGYFVEALRTHGTILVPLNSLPQPPPASAKQAFLECIIDGKLAPYNLTALMSPDPATWDAVLAARPGEVLAGFPMDWLTTHAPPPVLRREAERRAEALASLTQAERIEVLLALPGKASIELLKKECGRDSGNRIVVYSSVVRCAVAAGENVGGAVEWVLGRLHNEAGNVRVSVAGLVLNTVTAAPHKAWEGCVLLPRLFAEVMAKSPDDISGSIIAWYTRCYADLLLHPSDKWNSPVMEALAKYHEYVLTRISAVDLAGGVVDVVWSTFKASPRLPLGSALNSLCSRFLLPAFRAVEDQNVESIKKHWKHPPAMPALLRVLLRVPYQWGKLSPLWTTLCTDAFQLAASRDPESLFTMLPRRANHYALLGDPTFKKGLVALARHRTPYFPIFSGSYASVAQLFSDLLSTPAHPPHIAWALHHAGLRKSQLEEVLGWIAPPHLDTLLAIAPLLRPSPPLCNPSLWVRLDAVAPLRGVFEVLGKSGSWEYIAFQVRQGRYSHVASAMQREIHRGCFSARGTATVEQVVQVVDTVTPLHFHRNVRPRRRYNRKISRKIQRERRRPEGRAPLPSNLEAVVAEGLRVLPIRSPSCLTRYLRPVDPLLPRLLPRLRAFFKDVHPSPYQTRLVALGVFDQAFMKSLSRPLFDANGYVQGVPELVSFALTKRKYIRLLLSSKWAGHLFASFPELTHQAMLHHQHTLTALTRKGIHKVVLEKQYTRNPFSNMEQHRVVAGVRQSVSPLLRLLPPDMQQEIVDEWVSWVSTDPAPCTEAVLRMGHSAVLNSVMATRAQYVALGSASVSGLPILSSVLRDGVPIPPLPSPPKPSRYLLVARLATAAAVSAGLAGGVVWGIGFALSVPVPVAVVTPVIAGLVGAMVSFRHREEEAPEISDTEKKAMESLQRERLTDQLLNALSVSSHPAEAAHVLLEMRDTLKHPRIDPLMCSVLRCVDPALAGELLRKGLQRANVSSQGQLCRAAIQFNIPGVDDLLRGVWENNPHRDVMVNILCSLLQNATLLPAFRSLFADALEHDTHSSYIITNVAHALAGTASTETLNLVAWPANAPPALLTLVARALSDVCSKESAKTAVGRFLASGAPLDKDSVEALKTIRATLLQDVPSVSESAGTIGQVSAALEKAGVLSPVDHARTLSGLRGQVASLVSFAVAYMSHMTTESRWVVAGELLREGTPSIAICIITLSSSLPFDDVARNIAPHADILCCAPKSVQSLYKATTVPPLSEASTHLEKILHAVNSPMYASVLLKDPSLQIRALAEKHCDGPLKH